MNEDDDAETYLITFRICVPDHELSPEVWTWDGGIGILREMETLATNNPHLVSVTKEVKL